MVNMLNSLELFHIPGATYQPHMSFIVNRKHCFLLPVFMGCINTSTELYTLKFKKSSK